MEGLVIQKVFNELQSPNGLKGETIYDIETNFPNSLPLRFYLGIFYKRRNQVEEAVEQFNKCIDICVSFSGAYFELEGLIPNEALWSLLKGIFRKKTTRLTSTKIIRELHIETQLRVCSILKDELPKKSEVLEYGLSLLRPLKSFNTIETQCWKNMTLELGGLLDPRGAVELFKEGLSRPKGDLKNLDINKHLINGCYTMSNYISSEPLRANTTENLSLPNVDNFFESFRKPMASGTLSRGHSTASGTLATGQAFGNTFLNSSKPVLGYITPDLNKNAVGLFLTPLLKYNSAFKVIVYYNKDKKDEFTHQLLKYDFKFVDISGMKDLEVVSQIRSDKVRILVDLIGHGSDNRMEVLAMKPAPIIINYLGFPASTQLKEIDYRIVDKITDPVRRSSEKLIYLDRCFICFHLFENVKTPLIRHTTSKKMRVGLFHRWLKINPYMIKIMKDIGPVEYVIKREMNSHRSKEPWPNATYLEFGENLDVYFDMYNRIDLTLDTYPYSGTTITCSSLFMGVPVVTIYSKENSHVSNVTASILTHLGLEKWIAKDRKELVSIVQKFTPLSLDERNELRKKFIEYMEPKLFMLEYESKLLETICNG